jgi:hypothetical protein
MLIVLRFINLILLSMSLILRLLAIATHSRSSSQFTLRARYQFTEIFNKTTLNVEQLLSLTGAMQSVPRILLYVVIELLTVD